MMTRQLQTTQPYTLALSEVKHEITQIREKGARVLKQPGRDLMPVKRDMLLLLPDDEAALVLETCELLFAASLAFEDARIRERKAADAVSLAEARMTAGIAEGTVLALFYGPTVHCILTASSMAPIAFYALAAVSPKLQIIAKCDRAIKALRGSSKVGSECNV